MKDLTAAARSRAAADASSARSAFVIARATHTSARRPALRRTDSPRIPPTTFPLVSGRSTWRGRSFPPISRPISAPFPPPCASRSSRPSSRCSRDCPAVTSSCNAPRLRVALGLLLPLLRCDARPIHELLRSRPLVAADFSEPLFEPWVEGAEGASAGPKVEQHLA